ncbi:hypothetical protein [Acinetobacter rathckeae]|uniref:hypothetical protein n=1 Tax=Acinetobacter rathckeae TaxID=2605272 RepID=UPI0018A2BE67|nr:hypothetical protein [Acinetobacter rathckeae]MBF7688782.1 hypothetical protein [Acinetobacter rathckeae]MBF7696259.1 hypothetical protein [Acinetobacter rathckeae]
MRHILFITGLLVGFSSLHSVYAEPAVQPGQTLESLSKVTISTTVNDQPGSLEKLLQSGEYQLISPDPINTNTPSSNTDNVPVRSK